MTATVGTCNLRASHPKCAIFVAVNGTWDGVIKGRPSTSRLELGLRCIQGSIASGTVINTVVVGVVIRVRARPLSSLLSQDSEYPPYRPDCLPI